MSVLYGIGIGPGAPDLITLRAVNALARADVILAAASPSNEQSLALSIARPHINPDARICRLDFPMTHDRALLARAWRNAGQTAAAILAQGRSAAFITLGDPLIYSTFAYLQKEVKKLAPQAEIRIIPGITSFQAAAAKTGMSLCEGAQPFTLVSGIAPEAELRRMLSNPGAAAILKVYRQHETIKKALTASGRASIKASFIEQDREEISAGPGEGQPPYLTLLLCPGQKEP